MTEQEQKPVLFWHVSEVPPNVKMHPELLLHAFRFDSGWASKGHQTKHSSQDILGSRLQYWIMDTDEARIAFGKFVEQKFMELHPDAAQRIRQVLTSMLHAYNIHWSRCMHNKRQQRFWTTCPKCGHGFEG